MICDVPELSRRTTRLIGSCEPSDFRQPGITSDQLMKSPPMIFVICVAVRFGVPARHVAFDALFVPLATELKFTTTATSDTAIGNDMIGACLSFTFGNAALVGLNGEL